MFKCVISLFLLIPVNLLAQDIRAGAILPLSGSFASYGNEIRDGLSLAIEDAKTNDVSVSLALEDLPKPGQQAIVALKKLISQDKIDLLAGNFFNPAMVSMAPILNKSEVIGFHTAVADDLILSSGDYVFSVNARTKDEAQLISERMKSRGANNIAVVAVATSFGEEYLRNVVQSFSTLGGKIVMQDTTPLDEVDFKTLCGRIRASKVDAVFAGYFGVLLGNFVKQLRQAGVTAPVFTVYEAEDLSVVDVAGELLNGVEYFIPDGAQNNPSWLSFGERFLSKFGRNPQPLARISYDSLSLYVEIWKSCKAERSCIKRSIYTRGKYHGVSGNLEIEKDGGSKRDMRLRTYLGGTFKDAE